MDNFKMKLNICGCNQGQRGDLIMNTVVARAIKEKFPSSHFSLGINKRYGDMKELFYLHPYIDSITVWDGYDNWPTQNDINCTKKFDIVLHPMPRHPNDHCWYNLINRQTEASCIMNGFVPPKDLSCYLNRYFNLDGKYKDCVCISPFTAWDKKNISNKKWQEIIDYITNKGYNVIQIGDRNEFKFKNTEKINCSYFESVKVMLSCRFLITLDGGMNWVSSAYQHKTLGLMGLHYDNLKSSELYQPINKNARYLESNTAENIDNKIIFNQMDLLLNEN